MTDNSPFTHLKRIPTSGVMFIALMMVLAALLVAANGATHDAAIRPVVTVPTAAATTSGS